MNHNLKIKPRDTDYILGATSPIQFKAVSSGTWKVWFNEDQRNPNFDDDGCACYAANKSVDVQMDFLISIGKIPETIVNQLTTMGFMDSTSLDGKPHFHSSPRFTEIMTGNGISGNSMPECFDAIRKNGLVPWTSAPFTQSMTQQEYFNPTNLSALKEIGQQVLTLLGGKNFLQYHWIWQDSTKNMSLMQSASLQAPCGLGIAVNEAGYNQPIPLDPPASQAVQHAVLETSVFAPSCEFSDDYNPYTKTADSGYPIPFCIQAIVSPIINIPQPQPVPTLPPQRRQKLPSNPFLTSANVSFISSPISLFHPVPSL